MNEVEAKIKLTKQEFKKLINKFNHPHFFDQKNILYETPKGFVRIRKEKERKILTLKKTAEGDFNTREEIEFEVKSDIPTLKLFFKNLGLKETLAFRKYRANIFKNNCIISLDIPKKNNYYIEIEGASEEIRKIINELNLQDHKIEKRSYLQIFKSPK